MTESFSRRTFLHYAAASGVTLFACGRNLTVAQPRVCQPTESNIEGPFFRPAAPERSTLARRGAPGTPLIVSGRVLGPECAPLRNVKLEFWQADHRGAYDNDGFSFRAQLRTNADGEYRLETIVPGHYLNGSRYRPAHIHVKVHPRNRAVLTTQLYFAGDPHNDHDPFIRESLIMEPVVRADGAHLATFDFVA